MFAQNYLLIERLLYKRSHPAMLPPPPSSYYPKRETDQKLFFVVVVFCHRAFVSALDLSAGQVADGTSCGSGRVCRQGHCVAY